MVLVALPLIIGDQVVFKAAEADTVATEQITAYLKSWKKSAADAASLFNANPAIVSRLLKHGKVA